MAIVSCVELGRTKKTDNEGHRTYTRTFKVLSDDKKESTTAVEAAPGILWGEPYVVENESDLFAYALPFDTRLAQEDSSLMLWVVTVTYSSKPQPVQYPSGGGLAVPTGTPPSAQAPLSPPDRAWSVTRGSFRIKTPMYQDRGTIPKKVYCSNGLKYPQPVEANHVVKTITINAWKDPALYDLDAAQSEFIDSTNDATWQGKPAGFYKCDDLDGETLWEQGAWWLKLKVVLHALPGTMLCYIDYPGNLDLATPEASWDIELMNVGLKELVSGEHRPIMDKFNKPVSEPHPLTFNGQKLTIPAYGTDPSYTYKRYRIYPRKDWTNII